MKSSKKQILSQADRALSLTRSVVENSLKSFLAEDVGHGDITTNALIGPNQKGVGQVVCKQDAVIAGLEEAEFLLELADCSGKAFVRDGQRVKANTRILSVEGPARALLTLERTLLNLLSHMSGVATATEDLVSIAKHAGRGKVRIACTRKTIPGLRYFEKRAVELGGGDAHRLRLDDAVLIKDNHLEFASSLSDSIRQAKSKVSFTKKIEVEVTDSKQAVEAAEAGADIVLLDNMTAEEVERSVNLLREKHLREKILVEASGGITRENLASYALTGVDVISVGTITHSAKAIDLSMEIQPSKKQDS